MNMKKLMFLFCLFLGSVTILAGGIISVELPVIDTLILVPYAVLDFDEINESSALIKSRIWDDVYWTLNDSGSENKLYPITRDGKLIRAEWQKQHEGGIYVGDAVNVDWESLTTDALGNIYIGACGNNLNARQDLCIYILKDPYPQATSLTRYYQKINFYYPEQSEFPAPALDRNYDCEAIFWADGRIFLLTKHRSDTLTNLYTLNNMYPEKQNALTRLSTFDIRGAVTAAECNDDGTKLAVLTYSAVWLFEGKVGDWFSGSIKWLPVMAKQCEAICFDDDETLLITNEQMEMFELKIQNLHQVR